MKRSILFGGILAMAMLVGIAANAAEPTAAADCANPVGEWENEFGSIFEIQSVDPSTSAVTGRYQLRALPDIWFPAQGWVNSGAGSKHTVPSVISFAVHFGAAGSITSWTGTCDERRGTPEMKTLLQMARPSSPNPWDHIAAGAETFTPQ
jgi:hypothetical protein